MPVIMFFLAIFAPILIAYFIGIPVLAIVLSPILIRKFIKFHKVSSLIWEIVLLLLFGLVIATIINLSLMNWNIGLMFLLA